jgi:hypothetical protein
MPDRPVRFAVLSLLGLLCAACAESVQESPPVSRLEIFRDNVIHFTPDDTSKYDTAMVTAVDRGRVLTTYRELSRPAYPVRITARVALRPIRKDIRNVHDRWDRAGNVRLAKPGMPDVEIVKFITSYGGATEHAADVSHLAPLLDGHCVFKAFVDTWVSPAWEIDFELVFEPDPAADNPDQVLALLFAESVTAENVAGPSLETEVDIPDGVERAVVYYFTSGHCTDGRDADEFITKDNVIRVDGTERLRLRPWRDDCRRFRELNAYCARWSDGSWSSDYSRSGWCPGDAVAPVAVDLTRILTPGRHRVRFEVEDIRPRDAEGHFGYWRLSAQLLLWRGNR